MVVDLVIDKLEYFLFISRDMFIKSNRKVCKALCKISMLFLQPNLFLVNLEMQLNHPIHTST